MLLTLKKGKTISVIGLMSGTSMDGIDVAHLKTDGRTIFERGLSKTYPYPGDTLDQLKILVNKGESSSESEIQPVEKLITQAHTEVVKTFIDEFKLNEIDLIGFHGHTFIHRPDKGYTRQLGYGQLLADEIGIPVIYDFRSNDVSQGGQGAPLAPVYHKVLLGESMDPCVLVNIGGVSNITYVCGEDLISFDTGPGNALIDDWVQGNSDLAYDQEGQLALKGQIDQQILLKLMTHPYFSKSPPKSLDRNDFNELARCIKALSLEDGCATLAAFTAKSIAESADVLSHKPLKWVLSGGGRHNRAILRRLKEYLPQTEIILIEDMGYDGDALEAELMGYLAARSLNNLPISYPTTTGVQVPTTGGVYVDPSRSQEVSRFGL